ncbi:MAG: response regulator, partial [Gammaproteobacteria bacterium]
MPTILVVEDEAISGIAIRQQLERMGYRVPAIVGAGEEALRWVETERPDLVLMDNALAGEMDGVDTAKVLRERFDVPVIYVTGRTDQEFVQRAKTTKPLGYIAKPFAENELGAVVELALSTLQWTKGTQEGADRDLKIWFGLLFDLSRDATFLLTKDGVILEANSAVTEVFGYAREELIGTRIDGVFDGSLKFDFVKKELPAGSECETVSMRCGHVCKDGTVFEGEVVFRPVSYAGQQFYAVTSRGGCSEARARYLAEHDVLTGLANRRGLAGRLGAVLAAARRRGWPSGCWRRWGGH